MPINVLVLSGIFSGTKSFRVPEYGTKSFRVPEYGNGNENLASSIYSDVQPLQNALSRNRMDSRISVPNELEHPTQDDKKLLQ
jgi:hypothetical protein